jgi:GTP pyrophosphokinase
VSLADKLHNARSILADVRVEGLKTFEKFSGGLEGTLWYYRTLCDRFLKLRGGLMAEELDRTVREIEHLSAQASNRLTISPPGT